LQGRRVSQRCLLLQSHTCTRIESGTDKLTSIPLASRYDVATLYMQQADWSLEAAIEAYREDERWEKEHPMQAHEKGKKAKSVGMRRFVGSGANAAK
jgi:hypothetical protein